MELKCNICGVITDWTTIKTFDKKDEFVCPDGCIKIQQVKIKMCYKMKKENKDTTDYHYVTTIEKKIQKEAEGYICVKQGVGINVITECRIGGVRWTKYY